MKRPFKILVVVIALFAIFGLVGALNACSAPAPTPKPMGSPFEGYQRIEFQLPSGEMQEAIFRIMPWGDSGKFYYIILVNPPPEMPDFIDAFDFNNDEKIDNADWQFYFLAPLAGNPQIKIVDIKYYSIAVSGDSISGTKKESAQAPIEIENLTPTKAKWIYDQTQELISRILNAVKK